MAAAALRPGTASSRRTEQPRPVKVLDVPEHGKVAGSGQGGEQVRLDPVGMHHVRGQAANQVPQPANVEPDRRDGQGGPGEKFPTALASAFFQGTVPQPRQSAWKGQNQGVYSQVGGPLAQKAVGAEHQVQLGCGGSLPHLRDHGQEHALAAPDHARGIVIKDPHDLVPVGQPSQPSRR